MKKYVQIIAVFYFLLNVVCLQAQSWQPFDVAGFSTSADGQSLALDTNNTPYVAFMDRASSNKTTVMKFNGSSWVVVGNAGFSASQATSQSISIDSNNIPYVAYRDEANSSKTTVMKFDGVNWVYVGNPGFSGAAANYQSLVIDSNNIPYVAYQDLANSRKTTVMKFNGTNWVPVGNVGFSSGTTEFQSLALDNNNRLYVAFRDFNRGYRTTVMKFDGSNWVNVGNAGISLANSNYQSLALDNNNVPYVAYSDGSSSQLYKTTVMKFNGANWITVGNAGISAGPSDYQSLVIDSNNTPFVAFRDRVNTGKTIIMKFNGTNWETVGSSASNSSEYQSLAINSHNKLCIAYKDYNFGGRTTVKSFNNKPTVSNLNLIGNLLETQNLTANHLFEDIDNDAQNGSVYKWFRSDNSSGLNKTLIVTSTNNNYTIATTDVNKYISFSVTPKDGTFFGTEVESTLRGPIQGIPVLSSSEGDWLLLGNENFSTNNVVGSALDSNNTPYVVFRDRENSLKTTVMKFDGENWVFVGNAGFSDSVSIYHSLAIDSNDVPYVAYRDISNGRTTVMKFNGTNWVNVGIPGFSINGAFYQSLAIDKNNVPYVAFSGLNNSDKITVMKFNGINWVIVGNEWFSPSSSFDLKLALDSNSVPYVVFRSETNADKTSVMKFNGTNWVTVGGLLPSEGITRFQNIAIDKNNIPYVAYNDYGNFRKAKVMKFDGTNWVSVGNQNISLDQTSFLSLALDKNNNPFLAYSDSFYEEKSTVMKFDGVSWVPVGLTVSSPAGAFSQNLTINSFNKPYLAYRGPGTLGKTSLKIFNKIPTATNTTFTGTLTQGQQLSATYDYADANNDLEVGSTYQWFRSDDNVGLNKTAIVGATNQNYILVTADVNKFISFQVKPKDGTSFGTALESALQGAVQAIVIPPSSIGDWSLVGVAGFSSTSSYQFLALDTNDVPYVAFSDHSNSFKTTVMKFDGTNWILVGDAGFSSGQSTNLSLAFGSNNVPYIAFKDNGNLGKTTVMKFDGSNWVPVGNVGFSAGISEFQSLAIDNNNILYVAYRDDANSQKTTVMKYDGSNWVSVGSVGFSIGQSLFQSLAIDSNNIPYVAYRDVPNSNKTTVMKFDGINWITIGNTSSLSGITQNQSLAIDNNNLLYVAFSDFTNSSKTSVIKFDGTNWQHLGVTGFTSSPSLYQKIAIDNENTPYLAYSDGLNSYKTTVKKFDGVNWVTVGAALSSNGDTHYQSLAINSFNKPYVTYRDSGLSSKTSVQVFNAIPTATNVTFTGTLTQGQQLTGIYTYADANTDLENGSTYQWFRSDDNTGLNKVAIVGATNQNYTLTATEVGKFISFRVTPKDGTSFGTAVESALQGPISQAVTVFDALQDTGTVLQNSIYNVFNVLANDSFGILGPNATHPLTFTNGSKSSASVQGGLIIIYDNNTPNNLLDDVVLYTPKKDFNGTDSFNYVITDANGNAKTATVTITVTPIVAVYVPVAFDDITTVLINSTNNIINVLANDNFGLDGAINGGLTMTNGTRISASVQGGSINIDNKNTPNTLDDVFIYTPKAGFSGTDSFQYTITDASGDASTATVTVTVNALTDVPIAINDLVSVTENSINNSINVLLNDSFGSDGLSSLTLIGAFSSQGGTLSINNNATINTATDDTIVYTPATNYVGTDSFQYTITDSNGDASNATVTITIIAAVVINTTPIAQADVAVVNQNSTNNSIQVLLNDNFGANGPSATHPLTFANGSTSSASTNGGLISVGNNGTPNNLADDVILYSPKKDFNGTDSFNYVITDANGDASTATVTITVNVSSQVYVPTAVSDTATVNANSTNNIINVLANDTAGLDGYINNGLTMTNGTLTSGSDQGGFIRIENQGTNTTLDDVFLYSPKPGFSGIDTFRYTITDANGDASTTTVTVTVTAPINNSGPLLAVADTYSIDRSNGSGNAIVYFNVTSNDSFGPAGPNATHPLVLRNGITDTFSNGERRIRVDDNGTPNNLFDDRIAYYSTANPTFVTDSFIYTITDANGYASTATVTISLGVVSKTTGETNFFGTTTLKENTFLSYPNPSEGFVKTMLFSTINTTATILLFDITGKVIYNSETRITVGKNELDFNFNVKAGILFLKIISKEVDFGISKIVFK